MAISNGYQKEALLRCSKLIRILGLPNAVSQFNLEPQAPATTWLNDECHWSQHLIVQFQISPFFSQNSDCFPNRYERKAAFLICFFVVFFDLRVQVPAVPAFGARFMRSWLAKVAVERRRQELEKQRCLDQAQADRTGKTGWINPAIHGINMEIPW